MVALACWPETETMQCSGCGGRGQVQNYASTDHINCHRCDGTGRVLAIAIWGLLNGGEFDVAIARAYGERLVAEGLAACTPDARQTWAVYTDWCEQTGRRVGKRSRRAYANGPGSLWETGLPSGCSVHVSDDPGGGGTESFVVDGPNGQQTDSHASDAEAVAEANRRWAKLVPGPLPRPDGKAMVRLGQRLLDALAGQPSECATCCVQRQPDLDVIPGIEPVFNRRGVHAGDFTCSACRGTGHNLRGVLPPAGETPAQRARRQRRQERERVRYADSRALMRDVFARVTSSRGTGTEAPAVEGQP